MMAGFNVLPLTDSVSLCTLQVRQLTRMARWAKSICRLTRTFPEY